MSSPNFRREVLEAYSLPVGLFLVLPYLVITALGGFAQFFAALPFLPLLLAPLALVSYLLAPWAGSSLAVSKGPAFLMGALAAVAPAIVAAIAGSPPGEWGAGLVIVMAWALFAIPASVLGSILFIGACERRLSSEPESPR